MSYKKLIPTIYLKDAIAYKDLQCSQKIVMEMRCRFAVNYSNNGADEMIIMDMSYDDASHEEAISIIRQITKSIDTPVLVGGNVNRVEDVKKYLYAGQKLLC